MTLKTLTLTLGEETLSPHRYEGYRVGPISITIELGPDDTVDDVMTKTLPILKKTHDRLFMLQRDQYVEHHKAKG